MSAATITRDIAFRLASYVEDRRRSIVTSVVRSPALPRPGSVAAGVFANAFLDRLCQELEIGDRDIVDIWADAETGPDVAFENARIVVIACATISTTYAAECGHSDEVIAYLAIRSQELEARIRRAERSPKAADPSQLVSRDEIISSLLSAIDARDVATGDHSRAVGIWCARVAKAIGFGYEQQSVAALAGTMHDVGKIATPTEILLKPGALEDEEWEIMRAHARIGAKMLERIPSLAQFAPIVRAHHERVDGLGYPDGLEGDAIPMTARIIAVADSFHSMISKRPYRPARPVLEALAVLEAGAGSQWDPVVTEAMIGVVRPVRLPSIALVAPRIAAVS